MPPERKPLRLILEKVPVYIVLVSYFPTNQSNTQEIPSNAMLISTIYLILGKPVSKLTHACAHLVDQVEKRKCLP